MKPYSIDFRQKIIDFYEKENFSIRKLAAHFGVAKSFVQKLIKQYKETGDISPRKQGGSPPPKLNSEQLVILTEIIDNHNDATLEELCDLLEEKVGVKISRSTMSKIIRKLNYTFKKKHFTQQRKKVREFRIFE